MYSPQSLHDLLFLMFYGGVAMLALAAGIYLWMRRSNAIAPAVTPPKALRRWTSAFFVTSAMSHVWWYVLGVYWFADDRLTRNTLCIMLDHITLVPLVMALLLRILQDHQRRIWPWVVPQVLVIGGASMGIVNHSDYGLDLMHNCLVVIIVIFVTYYIFALVRYSRWLRDNYADLEHKEVWQSLLFTIVLFVFYQAYSTNPGDMPREYLSQFATLLIIGFLLWRVETLQQLDPIDDEKEEAPKGIDLGELLKQNCEDKQIYLQHDLNLQQLATIIGTNRTYLSAFFAQQGITYNTYINRLRIEHFIRLYHENKGTMPSTTAITLAKQSGFHSYSTFSVAFKRYTGTTVTEWMKSE